ncbi:hypothetical protein BB561_002289 [Smittium simulii]|uniref:A to I editase domain-containing protein n=1 Tax=Smittium simulii TaxID=133385 RepID=A0A2T9YQW2_9FUNG|nr:hypothetical protein BB561_002289 [Smittium simulii]
MDQNKNLSEIISSCVFKKYNSLPKKGKPAKKNESSTEWTILAGIVKQDQDEFECVSLATGTKCLGGGSLSKFGDLVNDSHAEILAKRSFILYLIDQINDLISPTYNNDSIFYLNEKSDPDEHNPCETNIFKFLNRRLKLKNVYFHFYSSQCPCGDASTSSLLSSLIDSNKTSKDQIASDPQIKRKNSTSEYNNIEKFSINGDHTKKNKRFKENDYTNSKDSEIKILRGRENLLKLNSLRTKPGRFDADSTLSMSCSDKIALWNVTGIQSSIMSTLLDPIYLHSIIISDYFIKDEVDRSLNQRIFDSNGIFHPYKLNRLLILLTNLEFIHGLEAVKNNYPNLIHIPCEASIDWYLNKKLTIDKNIQEVIVKGKKQGSANKKNFEKLKSTSRSRLCKLEMFKAFKIVISNLFRYLAEKKNINLEITDVEKTLNEKTYKNLKLDSAEYQKVKHYIKNSEFKGWIQKPDNLENFYT